MELWLYQNQQPGPPADTGQVGKWLHIVTPQTITEPAEHARRLRLQKGQPLHLGKQRCGWTRHMLEHTSQHYSIFAQLC